MSKFDFLDRFNQPARLDVDRMALDDFAGEVGGRIVRSQSGSYLEIISDYNIHYQHGDHRLGSVLGQSSWRMDYFSFENNDPLDLKDCLFIDTETTGLSAASGTVAFLVGIGYLHNDSFRVHQLFLPDYSDEPAMLEGLTDLLSDRRCLMSYNGKCFDLPLLETRYTMQRQNNPFAECSHIDLLHSCRRFWRRRLSDLTLQTVEKEILGFYRSDDVPSYLIPQLYFDYLARGVPDPLAGVFLHNRRDIVSLLFVADAIQRYLGNAEQFAYYSPQEALRIARFFERQGKVERSIKASTAQFSGDDGGEDHVNLGLHLSWLQRRLERFDEALATLLKLTQCRGETKLRILEGAAKILEHKRRDFSGASRMTLKAIEYLESPLVDLSPQRVSFWSDLLTRRRNRLLKKANKISQEQ